MIRPLDAWTLRRLVTGLHVNGELQALSGPFRLLGDRLADLPVRDRQNALEGFLAGREDAAEIVLALADVDPTGSPPHPGPDDPVDDWPPLRFGELPGVEPFPVDVLPMPAARLVIEGAEAIGCPRDFVALPALAVAGGIIGRSISLFLKHNYFAGATIFASCVGPPSDGKTPALKAVAAAVRRIDKSLEAEHEQAMERWQEECSRDGPNGKKRKPPPPPKPQRIDIDDITMEALPLILADNPRGLLMIRDELTAFVMGMNQFKGGKGNDRANALKLWSGDAIKKDRVNHENNVPIRCPHPTLSIVGGMPPDMLGALLDPKGRADGFIDRFLLAYPDPRPVADWSERGIPEETIDDWSGLVARLWARPMNVKEGRPVPHVAHFTPEGKAAWRGHYDSHADEMNRADFPPQLRGPWGKLREYAGRLTLILACLDLAADPTAEPSDVPAVGPRIVDDAWRLVAYFKSHSRRVHAAIALGSGIGGSPVVRAIVEWVRAGRRSSFSERDVKQARRWIDSEKLAEALDYLTDRNVIRPQEVPSDRPKVGRPSSPVFDVNPALLNTQNPQNTQNPLSTEGRDRGFEDSEDFESERGGEL
jgi:hypothetical protein